MQVILCPIQRLFLFYQVISSAWYCVSSAEVAAVCLVAPFVQALEAMILFLVGSGVDVGSVRASIRLLEETQYVSPLTAAGHQQQLLQQQPYTSSKADMQQMQQFPNSPRSTSPAEPVKRTNSQSSRPHSPSDPGSQQVTPRKPYHSGDSQRLQQTASNGNLKDSARPLASPTNPFASD